MIDKYISELHKEMALHSCTASQISGDLYKEEIQKDEKFIHLELFTHIIKRIKLDLEHYEMEREQFTKPYQKFMFIEDGSVDVDSLIETMGRKNPEIKVIIYGKGANKPELMDIDL